MVACKERVVQIFSLLGALGGETKEQVTPAAIYFAVVCFVAFSVDKFELLMRVSITVKSMSANNGQKTLHIIGKMHPLHAPGLDGTCIQRMMNPCMLYVLTSTRSTYCVTVRSDRIKTKQNKPPR